MTNEEFDQYRQKHVESIDEIQSLLHQVNYAETEGSNPFKTHLFTDSLREKDLKRLIRALAIYAYGMTSANFGVSRVAEAIDLMPEASIQELDKEIQRRKNKLN
jgi:hypothetical protein